MKTLIRIPIIGAIVMAALYIVGAAIVVIAPYLIAIFVMVAMYNGIAHLFKKEDPPEINPEDLRHVKVIKEQDLPKD